MTNSEVLKNLINQHAGEKFETTQSEITVEKTFNLFFFLTITQETARCI